MELLPMTFPSGFAPGLTAYATVPILGLLGRLARTGGVAEGFGCTDVLVVMGILAVMEPLADQIPWLRKVRQGWSTVKTWARRAPDCADPAAA